MPAYVPNLGELCKPDAERDAVHVAVVPVKAAMDFSAHDRRVAIMQKDGVYYAAPGSLTTPAIAAVDPFLPIPPRKGERFWAFLDPNTVVGLRHVYTHPALDAVKP